MEVSNLDVIVKWHLLWLSGCGDPPSTKGLSSTQQGERAGKEIRAWPIMARQDPSVMNKMQAQSNFGALHKMTQIWHQKDLKDGSLWLYYHCPLFFQCPTLCAGHIFYLFFFSSLFIFLSFSSINIKLLHSPVVSTQLFEQNKNLEPLDNTPSVNGFWWCQPEENKQSQNPARRWQCGMEFVRPLEQGLTVEQSQMSVLYWAGYQKSPSGMRVGWARSCFLMLLTCQQGRRDACIKPWPKPVELPPYYNACDRNSSGTTLGVGRPWPLRTRPAALGPAWVGSASFDSMQFRPQGALDVVGLFLSKFLH